MKRLHAMIIRAFLGPLAATFIIVLFILVMQFLWKYVDDLMGKGLEWYVLAELMVYATASFVPLALPLAVLLSSIMTMGRFGENSELVPMRSAGLGLPRIMLPLLALTLLLSAGSFWFSNNLLPVANMKFHSLLWDVTRKKPALNLRPGVFYNGIDGFAIRVMGKDDGTGGLRDVLIYDHRGAFQGNRTVLRAEQGEMRRSADGRYLLLTLYNGRFYDEHGPAGPQKGNEPMLRGTFERDEIRLDLTGMGLDRTDEELFRDHYRMLTTGQLRHAEDSLAERLAARCAEQEEQLRNGLYPLRKAPLPGPEGPHTGMQAFLASLTTTGRQQVYETAANMARGTQGFLERSIEERRGRREQIARFQAERHRKPMLAVACLAFFFIGAPLGAIIRRGGMGLPTVFAVIFFLIFHIISFSMEKLVISLELPAWPGIWIGVGVLLPIGAWLTWKAGNDSPLLDSDAYYRGWERFRALLRRRHAHPAVVQ
jgi:lipopolysaccharide export system permease protein